MSEVLEQKKPVWSAEQLCVDALHWSTIKRKTIRVTWDPEKTTLKYAAFHFIVHGSVPYDLLWTPSMEGWLRVNGNVVGHGGWAPWESCTSAEGTVTVTDMLINGDNTVEAEVHGYFLVGVTCCMEVTCEFILQWEGAPPTVTTPEEEMWKMIKYGIIGAGAIGATVVALKAYEVSRRK